MNLEILKQNFLTYLMTTIEEDKKLSEEEIQNISEISIFQYKKEFEEFVKDELGIKNFSGDINKLLELEENNSLQNNTNINKQENESFNEEFLNLVDDINNSEFNTKKVLNNDTTQQNNTLNNTNEKKKGFSFDFLGDIGKNLDEKQSNILGMLFDTDADGTFSKEEETVGLDFLKILDGKNDALSNDDMAVFESFIKGLGDKSNEEIVNHIKSLDGKKDSLSIDDFKKIVEGEAEQTETETLVESSETSNGGGSTSSSSSHSSSSSRSSSSSSSGKGASKEKSLENMSISELEKEMNNADTKITDSQDKYMQELDKIDKTLSDKIKDSNKKIKDTNNKIETTEKDINSYKTRISEIDGEISSLQAQLSSAQNSEGITENGENAEIPEIDTAAIESQIKKLQEEKEDIEKNKIPKLEENITSYQTELTNYQTELATNEAEVLKLGESHPSLKSEYETYKSALNEKQSIEKVLNKRKADQAKTKDDNYSRPDKGAGSKDYRVKDKFNYDNLPMSYNVDGKEYHCVGFEGYDLDNDGVIDFQPNSWEEVQRYFKNGGVENLGKYGSMQCHNYSDMLGQFVLGAANKDFVKALYEETNNPEYGNKDRAGQMGTSSEWNKRQFARCDAPDRDTQRAIIENELQNGRPCVVVVDNSSHWVAAVGISDDGDILIWDSYNGKMEKLGRTSNNDKEDLHRDLIAKDGVLVFCEDYRYKYGNPHFDYWQYIENGPDYIREHA